jgi:hypothetical protein
VFRRSLAEAKPQLSELSILFPSEVTEALQLLAVAPAIIEFFSRILTFELALPVKILSPRPAPVRVLFTTVQLVNASGRDPDASRPPPSPSEVFPEKVEFETSVLLSSLARAPPYNEA